MSLERGAPAVRLTVDTIAAAALIPSRDDGLHIMDTGGTLRAYDRTGALIGELETGLPNSFDTITLDPATGNWPSPPCPTAWSSSTR